MLDQKRKCGSATLALLNRRYDDIKFSILSVLPGERAVRRVMKRRIAS